MKLGSHAIVITKPTGSNDLGAHRKEVLRIAHKVVGVNEAAEDIAQEVMLRAWNHAGEIQNIPAWLRTCTVRVAINYLERTKTTEALSDQALDPGTTEMLEVQACLSGLSADHRAILALAIGEKLSYQEIADSLEISIGTVASRLSAAKSAFKRAWGEP